MSQKPNTANVLKERKPTKVEVDFMKLIEEQNVQRVLKLKKQRKNNILTGKLQNLAKKFSSLIRHDFFSLPACAIGVSVLGIYGYSMYAVKQEKFLDDFEEPAKEEIPEQKF